MRRDLFGTVLAVILVCLTTSLSWGQSITTRGSVTLGSCASVAMQGNVAYAAGTNLFFVVSAANPDLPTVLGQVSTGASNVTGIAASSAYAYCAGNAAGLIVVQVSDQAHPSVATIYSLGTSVRDVAVFDTLVAVATPTYVALLGVRTPAHPHLLASYGRSASWVEFDPSGHRLYVGSTTGVFDLNVIVNHSGSQDTYSLGFHSNYGTAPLTPIALAGTYLDAVQSPSTVIALHSDTLLRAGEYMVSGTIRGIAGASGYALLALATPSVAMINQQHDTPLFVATAGLPSIPSGIALGQDGATRLAAVSNTLGLTILTYSPLDAPEPPISVIPDQIALRAYPNPFNATISLSLAVPHPGSYDFSLVDALGRTVEQRTLALNGPVTERLNFSARGAGIYFARLANSEANATIKLIYLP